MSANFPAIDPATLAALNGGDEKALERIFRSSYAAVLERAKEKLGEEAAAAPRLVAGVFREVWEQRAELTSAQALEGFVNEEVRHRASATRSRMAAVHRFEKTEGVQVAGHHAPPSADQLWSEILTALHAPPPDSETRQAVRREHAKHEAAEHISRVAEKRSWKGPVLLGTVAAAIGITAFVMIGKASRESVVTQMLAAAEQDAVTTRAGQLGSLSLGDGTGVRLGVESRLVVVPEFAKKYRTVRLGGSAAIAVAPGKEMPLELRMGDAIVQASGGGFAVRDYADEALRLVRADSGSVQVRVGDASRTLASGETVAIGRDGVVRDATADEVAQGFAWIDGRLMLRDVTVEAAVKQLWRWYGLALNIGDDALKSRTLALEAPLESSQAAIAALESGAALQFGWEEGKMMLRDRPAARR